MKYKIIMSAGDPIVIEKDEVEKVMVGASKRALVICRQGIVNPAHLVSVVAAPGEYDGTGIPMEERPPEKPLRDLFPELREKILALGEEKKLLK